MSTALNDSLTFPHVGQVFCLERTVTHVKPQRVSHEVVVGLTSRGPDRATPQDLLRFVRGHWTIENNVHWVRDTAWREDASKIRTGAAPRIMASLRNAVLGVLALKGQRKITETLRRMAWKADRAIALVMQRPNGIRADCRP